jgi:serine/threonine protein kinase
MELTDGVVEHLRQALSTPDLSGTHFELQDEIGRGGMGVVYAARDRNLERRVALKVIDAPIDGEAQLIARLEHPAIVPVYDTGILPDGRTWYAMKLVSGARLDRYLAGAPSPAERLRVFRRVGEAVAFAHTLGAMHRDLKPQNIMVGRFGEVYVMDWGVPAVAGTPAFRAPEGAHDFRSDIYALGALLQFILPAGASPALRAIAAKAMQADPAARYPDAPALLADIDRFQDGLAVEAWKEPLGHGLRRFGSRNAVLLWLLAAYASVKFLFFFLKTL